MRRIVTGSNLTAITFSLDCQLLVACGWDNTLSFWKIESGENIRRFTGLHGVVVEICFTDDGKLFLAGSDGGLHLYELASNFDAPPKLLVSMFADDDGAQGEPGTIIPPERCSWYSVDYRDDPRGLWRGNGPALDKLRYRLNGDTPQPYPWLPQEWLARDLPQLRAPDFPEK